MIRIKTPNDKLNVLFFSPLLKTLKNIKVKKAEYKTFKKTIIFLDIFKYLILYHKYDACSKNNIFSLEFKCAICTLKHEILTRKMIKLLFFLVEMLYYFLNNYTKGVHIVVDLHNYKSNFLRL